MVKVVERGPLGEMKVDPASAFCSAVRWAAVVIVYAGTPDSEAESPRARAWEMDDIYQRLAPNKLGSRRHDVNLSRGER